MRENLPAAGLVEDALRMNTAALERHQIKLEREYEEHLPPVCVDRNKVLQILINLLHNARHALTAGSREDKRLVIRLGRAGPGRVKITLADNGIGIDPNHLTRIFNHGFTTKRDGHGFGLHSGANAAKKSGRHAHGPQRGPGPRGRFYPGIAGGGRRRTGGSSGRARKEYMKSTELKPNRRVLIVDDNPNIHTDFRNILCADHSGDAAVNKLEAVLFEGQKAAPDLSGFEVESALQGREGLEMVKQALADGRPYALAFVDVRMPPGWDGIETIARIWECQPELQIVVCTACRLTSWEQIRAKVGQLDNLVILKKPCDNVEVQQLAHALTKKWLLKALPGGPAVRRNWRWRTNESLAKSEERFSKAFHESPLPSGLQSIPELRFVDVNQSLAEVAGRETRRR